MSKELEKDFIPTSEIIKQIFILFVCFFGLMLLCSLSPVLLSADLLLFIPTFGAFYIGFMDHPYVNKHNRTVSVFFMHSAFIHGHENSYRDRHLYPVLIRTAPILDYRKIQEIIVFYRKIILIKIMLFVLIFSPFIIWRPDTLEIFDLRLFMGMVVAWLICQKIKMKYLPPEEILDAIDLHNHTHDGEGIRKKNTYPLNVFQNLILLFFVLFLVYAYSPFKK